MGLFDIFKRKPDAPAPAPVPAAPAPPPPPPAAQAGERRFHLDRSRMFDLRHTQALAELLAVPLEARDHTWSDRFHDAVWTASVYIPEPAVISGPDGMPYLRLVLPPQGVPFDSQCLANVASDCVEDLRGAALFASEGDPPEGALYVFPMGVLHSLLQYDSPDGDPVDVADMALPPPEEGMFSGGGDGLRQGLVVEKAHDILVGSPSADFLPPHLAFALWRYVTQIWKLEDPRVAIVVDHHMRPRRSLVIGRKASEFGPDDDIALMVRYLTWYLPPLRMVMLMPEDWSLETMTPLSELFDASQV
ncbi:MAG TPA: hypothetical protein VF552_01940 [Allosphingosinicella sp.]|jgi:hypothetical protein